MDKLDLIRELNKGTIRDEFTRALEESGFDLPEDDFEDDVEAELDSEMGDEELDTDGEEEYDGDTGLEDDELQEIADWCEEECADLSDDELKDTLRDELEEVDLTPEQMDATVDRVMSMIGRGSEDMGSEEEMGDELDDLESEDEMLPPSEEECEY